MRAEIDVASPSGEGALLAPERSLARGERRGYRPDWFELLVLIAFAAISMWVVALDLYRASVHGLVWTGTDGFYIVDQMQYLAWIQEASRHVLVSNLFVLRPTAADYFQPATAISGGLVALGVAPWLALLLWKPVAVVGLFYALRAFAARSLTRIWDRRIALALGLFFGPITILYGALGVLGDLYPPWLSWGYPFGLLAIALLLFSLVAYDRARTAASKPGRWIVWVPGILGALASLIHPWQGELLILIVIFAESLLWLLERRRPLVALPFLTIALTGAPLLYYEILGRTDLSWKLARDASKHAFSLGTIVLAIIPLLLPALLVYFRRPRTFLAAATRMWMVAALSIFVLSASSVSATPLHAFEGIAIPLSVLAIQGIRRAGLTRLPVSSWIAAGLVLAVTVPAVVLELQSARSDVVPTSGNANFIRHDEQKALRYLADDPQPGGVLTGLYLGQVVPAETGRRTFIGDCLWSEPRCLGRAQLVQPLFHGPMPAKTARRYIQELGPHFVLGACDTRKDLDEVMAPLIASEHRFGCAAVYQLRTWHR